jgi:hypothetical protein
MMPPIRRQGWAAKKFGSTRSKRIAGSRRRDVTQVADAKANTSPPANAVASRRHGAVDAQSQQPRPESEAGEANAGQKQSRVADMLKAPRRIFCKAADSNKRIDTAHRWQRFRSDGLSRPYYRRPGFASERQPACEHLV